jgi:hypothetical protein
MIGIYKIENLINGKVYIGQSIHIERRWQEHCQPSSRSLIGKAIQKYGKEHFTFQVLDECSEEYLDELEERYISVYNSVVPNGYNIETASKGKTSFVFYDQEIFTDIVKDITSSDLTLVAIAEKYDLSRRTIQRINQGDVHHDINKVYPLRDTAKPSRNTKCVDCGKEITPGATRCVDCANKAQRSVERPSREVLKKLVRTKSFVEIGKMYGVADNSIKKWCIAEGVPSKITDIKTYSDEEWALI